MALKDLIASKASMAEDVIEEVVAEYVRFDVDEKAVFLTPESDGLSNKSRVLVYLVALQGWPFVLDEVVPVDAKPGDIERRTGIPGGTLRPILKELKDRRIIIEKGGQYSVLSSALRAIKAELDGARGTSTTRPSKRKSKRSTGANPEADSEAEGSEPEEKRRSRRSSSTNAAESFSSWIDSGFFDQARTLSDVQQRFHQEGMIVPQTNIPGYLLKAVRSRRLRREKADVKGKNVWTYSTMK